MCVAHRPARTREAKLARDPRAEVAALRAVALVAEPAHQLGPGLGDAVEAPARSRGPVRRSRSRAARGDDVEGVGRIAAVGAGIGQRADDVEELDDRAGPAVGEDQRHRVGFGRTDVQEVDVLPVDRPS